MKKNILIGTLYFISGAIFSQVSYKENKFTISASNAEIVNKKVDSLLSIMTLE